MLLIVPEEFSAKAMAGEPTAVRVVNTQHLSVAEAQFGAALPGQLQANMSLAVTLVRQALARGVPPNPGAPLPVSAEVQTLHAVTDGRALLAPFCLDVSRVAVGSCRRHHAARRLAAFRQSLLDDSRGRSAHPAAHRHRRRRHLVRDPRRRFLRRSVGPVFFAPWFYLWLVGLAAAWLFMGLFSVFSFFAIVVALPLAFYQGPIAGVIAPAAAAPGWLAWVADILPLDDLMFGMRAILIGGPDGAVPLGTVFVVLLVGLALIWAGTAGHAMRRGQPEAAGA